MISPRETHKRPTLYIISITKDLYENFKANLYRAIYMYVIIYWFPLSWNAYAKEYHYCMSFMSWGFQKRVEGVIYENILL